LRIAQSLTVAALLLSALHAQSTGSISGKVEDASGAAISGATVTVRSVETGAVRKTASGDDGSFNIVALPLGAQEVRVEKKGFKPALRSGIDLQVGQQAVVNFKLDVGEFVQEVSVIEEAPVVNTTTASVSGVVTENQVKDLPLNGRSFDNLITLNPGTVNYSAMKSANTSTSNGNTFSVEGRRTSENIILLNGIEYTGSSQLAITPGGVSGELLGIDAVREFNLLTDTYGAEYGKRAGGQVVVVTQSGTNSLHGTLFEFLRNSDLDARNFFDQASAPPFRRNQFGAAAGAPLKKNKAFIFGNYEGFRQALALSSVSVVPDSQARQGFLPNSAGVYTKVTNLNPAMLNYMSFWPAPNGPELLSNGVASGTALSYNNPRQNIREDFGTVRTDYNLGDRDRLSTAYTIDNGNNLTPNADPLFGSYETLQSQVASIQETHVISPYMLNTFTAGFSRAAFNFDSQLLAQFPSNLSFVSGAGPGGIVVGGGVTTTGTATITSAGPNNAAGVWNRRNLFTYTDAVQITHGIHQISAGVWFQRMQDNEDSASRQLGQATFTSLTTFLQGTASTFQVVPTANELGWRSWFGAWYVQDAIRLRPNLTLQLGLRDEFTTGWNEVSGRAANFITDSNGVLETAPVVGSSVFTKNNATHLWAPRVALAWDPFKDGKTAIRAGFGTYYSLIDDLAFLLNSLPPYNGSVTFAGALSSFLPIVPNAPVPPACGPGVPSPCTTYAPQGIQPNAQTPAVEEWNFTVERQLSSRTSLRVAYVGSHGYHGLLSIDPNSIPAQICTNSAGCVSGGTPGTTKGSVPNGAQYIPISSRPNPYLSGGFFWYTEGNSSYNALQTDVVQRLTHGLQFRANFTWAKNLDMNSGLTGAQANNQAQMILNRNDLPLDWGPSAFNIARQASFSASYDLPWSKSTNRLIGGWQLNLITTLLSGFPFTPQIGSNRSGDGDTRNPDRPNVNPAFTGPVIVGTQTQWYNPNAFSLPTPGTYGNLGRGVYTGPGLADVDFSLFKNTRINERLNLQFRAEFFNILNHTNLGTPNATVFSSGAISGSAGLITSTTTTSRQIQFGLKLIF
jgi:hypothetical protein